MMKILVTGVNGQVGHELARSLQPLGEVVALPRARMDLSDLDSVRAAVREVQPGLIVNPAAYTAVDKAEEEEVLATRINAEAPGLLAEEAKKIGAGMIHYSTDYVYDGKKTGAWLETDATNPLSAYGRSKLAGEDAIRAAGIPHIILRTSWVYGMRGKNFLLTMRRLAAEREELRVVGDQHGAPTWSRTIADTTAHIAARLNTAPDARAAWEEASGIYHLAAQGQTSWHGFAQAIVDGLALEKKPRVTAITTKEYPLPAVRPANSVLSCQKLMARFCRLPEWRTALDLCIQ